MNFLNNADWSFPVPIYYGPDRVKELSNFCKSKNLSRPLLVTDNSSSDLPFIKEVLKSLNSSNLKSEVFSDISPNPIDNEIYKGESFYKDGKHDSIVSIGGGSGGSRGSRTGQRL